MSVRYRKVLDKVKLGKHFASSGVNVVAHTFKICTKMLRANNNKKKSCKVRY